MSDTVKRIDVCYTRPLEKQIDQLERELARARKDADRYRKLRNPKRMHTITVEQWGKDRRTLHSEALDVAVDALPDAAHGEQAQGEAK